LRPFSVIVSFALALTTAACASTPSRAARESPDKITSAEIRASGITNALDLINRLRPAWLRPTHTGAVGAGIRSQAIAVYLDGHRLGDLQALNSLGVSGIESMEWLDAVRAATVLSEIGSDPISGAILIRSR
jgi:hypothetical protein